MKRHSLASIEATQERPTERNQSQSKSHRQRIRISVRRIEAVTSSDRKTAFWMKEYNNVHQIDKAQPKRAYYKLFGKYIKIKDGEIAQYIEHNVEIFWF